MSTVSGYFSITQDGEVKTTAFDGIDYAKFWVAQKHVIDVLNSLSTMSVTAMLTGAQAQAKVPAVQSSVGYRFVASFEGGGSSTGETTWNGVSEADAKFIVAGLTKTAAGLV